jgi:hypothetical protein
MEVACPVQDGLSSVGLEDFIRIFATMTALE